MRAPKLVGVAVYDSDNKDVGKIADLLIDHDGKVQAVVIGIGGFLGIGSKDVAVPYSAMHWQTEQRTVAVNNRRPANGRRRSNAATTTTAGRSSRRRKTVDPAKTEAYHGYPDRAVIDMCAGATEVGARVQIRDRARRRPTAPAAPATPASKS